MTATMKSFFSLALIASLRFAKVHSQIPKTCNANPECAALGLADDCCPTSLAGIFLDCCEDPGPTCAVNSACAELNGNCCPTDNGVFLYCCFETPSEGGYATESSLFANSKVYPEAATSKSVTNQLEYWVSTGSATFIPDVDNLEYRYERNSKLVYDLLYLRGEIDNASDYVTGDRKFSITITDTTAPACTQIIFQLEHVKVNVESNSSSPFRPYPKGRHSRYLATIPEGGTGRIEFSFLDRPDDSVLDSKVNAAVLIFAPGKPTGDTFTFQNLDGLVKCNGSDNCRPSPTLACPALYVEVDSGTARALQSEDCTDCENPSCVGSENCSMDMSYLNLQEDPGFSTISDESEIPGTIEDTEVVDETVENTAVVDETMVDETTTSNTSDASKEEVGTPPIVTSGSDGSCFFGVASLAAVASLVVATVQLL